MADTSGPHSYLDSASSEVEHALSPPSSLDSRAVDMVIWTYRHTLPVRLAHWVNALCLIVLVMSGLQIFNAHPALYWGDRSDRNDALLSIRPVQTETGEIKGITTIFGHSFETTGLLGYSDHRGRAFPVWATLPGPQWLAMGRQWHLFFAWMFVITGVFFVGYGLLSRHLSRDLLPTTVDLRHIGRAVKNHLFLRHSEGEAATRYNVLQKLAYLVVLAVLAPVIVLTGLGMSPMIDAAFPWLLPLFGGRQGARTLHFIVCFAFVGFVAVHVLQVVMTGLVNNMRSMITGWFAVKGGRHDT
ncbi:MAG: Thiosulfate reductase cytochrome B subunit (membrane anchoring protein) [Nitrospira sp.]|jgi:Ni/Fe-hydrogenase b-type cytochrome subunit|nr:Thiosulfate reductase cytochrome B subunit (membrane anchoring protein) [Nitrospira sp.]